MLSEVSKPLNAEEMKRISEEMDDDDEGRKLTADEMKEFLARNKPKKKQRFAKITDMS